MLKIKNIIGVLFIALGLLANRVILEKFVSPYAIVELNYRVPIVLINLCLIVLGLFIIAFRKERFTSENIIKGYKLVALNFFGAFLLFAFFNILIYGFVVLKDVSFYKDQVFYSYNKPLKEIYPDSMGREVNLLLYETWSRPYVYEPYTQFKERPFKGKYVNVHRAGFRITENQGPWPPDPENKNIFLFGGSTTFGYGVRDEQTIASYLEQYLQSSGSKAYVYNFGRGNYFSSQEKNLFEELLVSGVKPDIAIFIDGLNDFYHVNNEPIFTERLRKFVDNKGKTLFVDLPLVNVIKDIKKIGDVHSDDTLNSNNKYDDKDLLYKAIHRYKNNKKIIEAIASLYGVKTVFVWQPVPTYKYDLKYHIFAGKGFGRFLYSKYGYKYMEDYVQKNDMGNNFLYLADIQENLKKPLYVDIDHYTAEFSSDVAKRISRFLLTNT